MRMKKKNQITRENLMELVGKHFFSGFEQK